MPSLETRIFSVDQCHNPALYSVPVRPQHALVTTSLHVCSSAMVEQDEQTALGDAFGGTVALQSASSQSTPHVRLQLLTVGVLQRFAAFASLQKSSVFSSAHTQTPHVLSHAPLSEEHLPLDLMEAHCWSPAWLVHAFLGALLT